MSPFLHAADLLATGLLGLLVPALALFALIRTPHPLPTVRGAREGSTLFLPGSWVERALALGQPLATYLARRGTSPDRITWIAAGLGGLSGCAAAGGYLGLAAFCFSISGLCDLLDGAVARARGLAGPRGAMLDSVLDRYVEAALHVGLLIFLANHTAWQAWCLASLFGGMMVTYSTAKAEALGLDPPRGWMKRAERMVWLGFGLLAGAAADHLDWDPHRPPAAALMLVAVFANLSAILRLRALGRTAAARGRSNRP